MSITCKAKSIFNYISESISSITSPKNSDSYPEIPDTRHREIQKIDLLIEKWRNGGPPFRNFKTTQFDEIIKETTLSKLSKVRSIQRCLSNSHYTFCHGSNPDIYIMNLFYKELSNLIHPEQYPKYAYPFRSPNKLSAGEEAIQKVRKQYPYDRFDYHRIAMNCLSVDAYLLSTERAESALYYGQYKKGWSLIDSRLSGAIREEIESRNLPKETQDLFKKKLGSLCDQLVPLDTPYGLWSISIPKEKIENFGYFAYPAGWKYEPDRSTQDILEDLQKDRIIKYSGYDKVVQYRLYPEKLHAGNDVLAIPFFDISEEKALQKIKKLAQEFHSELIKHNAC